MLSNRMLEGRVPCILSRLEQKFKRNFNAYRASLLEVFRVSAALSSSNRHRASVGLDLVAALHPLDARNTSSDNSAS
jgi:hypothetical protein